MIDEGVNVDISDGMGLISPFGLMEGAPYDHQINPLHSSFLVFSSTFSPAVFKV